MGRVLKSLYFQVIVGIIAGVLVGWLWPNIGADLKPLGDMFVKLIRIVVAPVIFCTVVSGIAHTRDLKAVGSVGLKALVYFEVVSTIALILGLIIGHIVQPGRGFNIDPATLDPSIAENYVKAAAGGGHGWEFVLGLVPNTFVGAFAEGNLLQTLVLAVLTGVACLRMGEFGGQVAHAMDQVTKVFFGLIHIVIRFAPIGAFGAMAFTIGQYGLTALVNLGALVATFYITALAFVIVILGIIAAMAGFSIFKFLAYIREELLIVFASSSSETVLPQLIQKMQTLGVSKQVAGLVLPTGYSFNLDGTNIYITLAMLFLAQAMNIELTLMQELSILGVAMLTSKGAAAVTGAGFITLAATLAVTPDIPITALALIVGIDRFMSECRALANVCGNGVATVLVARWDNQLDRAKLREALDRGPNAKAPIEAADPSA